MQRIRQGIKFEQWEDVAYSLRMLALWIEAQ